MPAANATIRAAYATNGDAFARPDSSSTANSASTTRTFRVCLRDIIIFKHLWKGVAGDELALFLFLMFFAKNK